MPSLSSIYPHVAWWRTLPVAHPNLKSQARRSALYQDSGISTEPSRCTKFYLRRLRQWSQNANATTFTAFSLKKLGCTEIFDLLKNLPPLTLQDLPRKIPLRRCRGVCQGTSSKGDKFQNSATAKARKSLPPSYSEALFSTDGTAAFALEFLDEMRRQERKHKEKLNFLRSTANLIPHCQSSRNQRAREEKDVQRSQTDR
jgi:hypothetical protein